MAVRQINILSSNLFQSRVLSNIRFQLPSWTKLLSWWIAVETNSVISRQMHSWPRAKSQMRNASVESFFFHCSTSITFIISRCVRCRRFLNFSFCWASNVCAFLSFYLYFSPTLRWLFVQIEKRSQAVLIHLAAPFSNWTLRQWCICMCI